jgi:hypothetical protein
VLAEAASVDAEEVSRVANVEKHMRAIPCRPRPILGADEP